jgi:hypothetical protein
MFGVVLRLFRRWWTNASKIQYERWIAAVQFLGKVKYRLFPPARDLAASRRGRRSPTDMVRIRRRRVGGGLVNEYEPTA